MSFTVTATGGAAPFRYLWNFGDGNASSAEDPTHAYAAPGEYAASVTVTDALSEAVTLTRTIDVAPLPLAISLTTSEPTVGAALATTVRANVTGGIPPFLYVWEFGDGSGAVGTSPTIVHTYGLAGSYAVTVQVTDGGGIAAVGSEQLNVTPLGTTGSACSGAVAGCGPLGLSALAWAAVVALAIAVVLLAGWRVIGRDRRHASGSPAEIPPGLLGESTVPGRAGPESPESAIRPTVRPPAITAGNGSEEKGTASAPDGRPMSARILLHLYRQGVPDPNRAVPVAFAQEGLAVALGRPQSAFARALLRLEEAGLIRAELAHVQGRGRRAKTYRLTPQGESAARRLGAAGPSSSAETVRDSRPPG